MEYKTLPKLNNNQKKQFLNRIESMNKNQALTDITPDILMFGLGGKAVESAAKGLSKAANMVSSRFYNPTTYKGLARNLSKNKTPVDVLNPAGIAKANLTNVEKIQLAEATADPYLLGSFNPQKFMYMAKDPSSKVHELQHAKDFIKGKSYGGSPEGNYNMFGRSMLNEARYAKKMSSPDKVLNMADKLYQGNVGERSARFAEHLYNRGLNSSKISPSKLAFEQRMFNAVEQAKGIHGIKNTLDPAGIVNKRILRDGLANKNFQNIAKASVADEFIQQKYNPLDIN